MMPDEDNSKSQTSPDSDEHFMPKSVPEEQENDAKVSADSYSANSGNRQAQMIIPTPEGTSNI